MVVTNTQRNYNGRRDVTLEWRHYHRSALVFFDNLEVADMGNGVFIL